MRRRIWQSDVPRAGLGSAVDDGDPAILVQGPRARCTWSARRRLSPRPSPVTRMFRRRYLLAERLGYNGNLFNPSFVNSAGDLTLYRDGVVSRPALATTAADRHAGRHATTTSDGNRPTTLTPISTCTASATSTARQPVRRRRGRGRDQPVRRVRNLAVSSSMLLSFERDGLGINLNGSCSTRSRTTRATSASPSTAASTHEFMQAD